MAHVYLFGGKYKDSNPTLPLFAADPESGARIRTRRFPTRFLIFGALLLSSLIVSHSLYQALFTSHNEPYLFSYHADKESPEQAAGLSATPKVVTDTFMLVSNGNWDQSKNTEPGVNSEDRHGKEFILQMMKHAWDSYENHGWGYDDLSPLTEHGSNWNDAEHSIGVTIIDSIDTLFIMGMKQEYERAREFISHLSFDVPVSVSVFETTIRVLGGLISAYDLTNDEMYKHKAVELADRLLPAFKTKTGVPNSYVNLHNGESKTLAWSNGAILADFGSIQLEFTRLTELTGDDKYRAHAMDAFETALHSGQPIANLYPLTYQTENGHWNVDNKYTVGGLADSFYEYLLKMYLFTGDENYRGLYEGAAHEIKKRLIDINKEGLTYLKSGHIHSLNHVMEHLACFTGGMFALGSKTMKSEDQVVFMELGKQLTETCHEMYRLTKTGLGPEEISVIDHHIINSNYILRPELAESLFYMWRLTHQNKYRVYGAQIALAIEKHCRLHGGYGGLLDVNDPEAGHINRQESFFTAETLKYLYLLFAEDSVLPLDKYVFNTEAHPFRIPAKKTNPVFSHHEHSQHAHIRHPHAKKHSLHKHEAHQDSHNHNTEQHHHENVHAHTEPEHHTTTEHVEAHSEPEHHATEHADKHTEPEHHATTEHANKHSEQEHHAFSEHADKQHKDVTTEEKKGSNHEEAHHYYYYYHEEVNNSADSPTTNQHTSEHSNEKEHHQHIEEHHETTTTHGETEHTEEHGHH